MSLLGEEGNDPIGGSIFVLGEEPNGVENTEGRDDLENRGLIEGNE